jgi:hypothetical protein
MLCPLETTNLNYWITYVSIITATQTSDIKLCQWEITGKTYNKNELLYEEKSLRKKKPDSYLRSGETSPQYHTVPFISMSVMIPPKRFPASVSLP